MGRGRKWQVYLLHFVLFGGLMGCVSQQGSIIPSPSTISSSVTPFLLVESTPTIQTTPTSRQSEYLQALELGTLQLPHLPTATKSPPEKCPADLDISTGDLLWKLYPVDVIKSLDQPEFTLWYLSEQEILDILNQYGAGPFYALLTQYNDRYLYPTIDLADINNDSTPEILLEWNRTYILACESGKYRTIVSYGNPIFIDYRKAFDGNHNGIPEVVFDDRGATGGSHSFNVIEWNGQEFIDLTRPYRGSDEFGHIFTNLDGSIDFVDIDNDGFYELKAYLGKYDDWYGMEYQLPWRDTWEIYKWDGQAYRFYQHIFSPPQYRFQALIDGDMASIYGRYDEAYRFYDQAMNDNTLDWWSALKRQVVYNQNIVHVPLPTGISLVADPNEYPNQAAYALFRIMLLDVKLGRDDQAQVEYDALIQQYPSNTPGSIFARLAQIFMDEYRSTRTMEQACNQVIDFADAHKAQVLRYIGLGGEVGNPILLYSTIDICPFQ